MPDPANTTKEELMAELSPAAQAVLDAMCSRWPRSHEWIAAAALRVAADQVVPMEKEPVEPPGYGIGEEPPEYVQDWTRWHVRSQFLAIAAELEATTPQQSATMPASTGEA